MSYGRNIYTLRKPRLATLIVGSPYHQSLSLAAYWPMQWQVAILILSLQLHCIMPPVLYFCLSSWRLHLQHTHRRTSRRSIRRCHLFRLPSNITHHLFCKVLNTYKKIILFAVIRLGYYSALKLYPFLRKTKAKRRKPKQL